MTDFCVWEHHRLPLIGTGLYHWNLQDRCALLYIDDAELKLAQVNILDCAHGEQHAGNGQGER
jgi:hypothetical protein